MTDTTQAAGLEALEKLKGIAGIVTHGKSAKVDEWCLTIRAALAAQAVPAGYVSLPREALRRDVAQAQKDLPYRASYLDWIIQYASPAPAEAKEERSSKMVSDFEQ